MISSISSPGVGSGLDVSKIVTQLMSLERQPLNRLESSKRDLETRLSAFGQLKSALTTFQSSIGDLKTLDSFEVYKAESSNESAFTASANSSAAPGFSTIQVNRLAQSHKMGSVAIADQDTTLLGGAGDQITLTVNGNAFTVAAGGMTLTQLADAINDAPDNTGVSASIISENATSNRLVLTSRDSGNINAMSLAFTGSLGTSLGMTDINDPALLDAEMVIDGLYTVTRPGNTIGDAISGVTLELQGVTTTAANLTVSRDLDAVKESVQAFVDAFNEMKSTIDGLSGEGNDLEADSTLRGIERRIQDVFGTAPSGLTGSYTFLSEVGVSLQRDGKLGLDTNKLETAIAADFAGMADVFANDDQGYLFRMDALINDVVAADGLIDNRQDGLNSRIDRVDQRILDMEYRLELREQRLYAQYNALDTLMGSLQGTSSFLTQQLANLPKINSASK